MPQIHPYILIMLHHLTVCDLCVIFAAHTIPV